MNQVPSQEVLNGLHLFKSLVKDKCEWQGDVFSRKWSECLFLLEETRREDVKRTLASYSEGVDYKLEGNINAVPFESVGIWIS
jgi:hypothetical protein